MTIGIIGCGNMAIAIAQGAIKAGAIENQALWVKNSTLESSERAAKILQANAAKNLAELVKKSDVLLLATKPNLLPYVLSELSALSIKNKLIISIAAGVSLRSIEGFLGVEQAIIRTMPNTPTLVKKGIIAYTPNAKCSQKDEERLIQLLQSSASLSKIPENLMDAVTGLSGSGPAYVYTFIEALADGAVAEGIPRPQALELAAKTVLGSAKMVLETGLHPAQLRDQVTSPGGTTIAAVTKLEEKGFRHATIEAVRASAKRSRELG